MDVTQIVQLLDEEIARLKQARAILSDGTGSSTKTVAALKKPARKKRTLSAEARKRIAEAQKRRWAAQKRGAK